jgi:prevent-host-death family protein
MKSYPVNEARAEFSTLIDKALGGEPQRVTRYGKEAVIIVSEAQWLARPASGRTLGDLLIEHARRGTFADFEPERPWNDDRPLGADIE